MEVEVEAHDGCWCELGVETRARSPHMFTHDDFVWPGEPKKQNYRVRNISMTSGVVRTLVGSGLPSMAAGKSMVMDGWGTNCTFSSMYGIAVDNNRSVLYVSDPDVRHVCGGDG